MSLYRWLMILLLLGFFTCYCNGFFGYALASLTEQECRQSEYSTNEFISVLSVILRYGIKNFQKMYGSMDEVSTMASTKEHHWSSLFTINIPFFRPK